VSQENATQSDTKETNILKSRDDHQPVEFHPTGEDEFMLSPDAQCSWSKPGDTFRVGTLRQRIEPWLTALFQSEHLSLLIGSGITHATHLTAKGDRLPGMGEVEFGAFQSQLEYAATNTAKRAGRQKANIEDQLRVSHELLVGLRHYCPKHVGFDCPDELRNEIDRLENEIKRVLSQFSNSILEGERGIATGDERDKAFEYLVNFLMSPASRSGTRDRLQIFTTNYDRVIEAGAEVAGLHLIDRFVGSITPIFRSSRLNLDMHYNPPGIRGEPRYLEGVVRFTKLHGSIDWISSGRAIRRIGLPFGAGSVDPFLSAPGLKDVDTLSLMIYPNSAKDRETTFYPYVDLFRDFAAAICRPNGTLVTYGCSFGDEHINRVIEDMLTIPSTHLVIIARSDSSGRIMKLWDRVSKPAQTTLLVGPHLGDLKILVDHFLPKPAIDRTTFRMAELLQARFATQPPQKTEEKESSGGEDDDS
jgi:hypothetical protein